MKAVHPLVKSIIKLDQALSLRVARVAESRLLGRVATVGAHLGDGWLWIVGSIIAFACGASSTRRLVLWLAFAILLSVGIGSIIKYTVRRTRPEETKGFYSRRIDNHSFPSGHAIRTACIATLCGATFPQWTALLILYVCLVALSRVALRIHYLGDVIAGGMIGSLGALLILSFV